MKTLTVQEASQDLGRWLRRAMGGEQIAIHEGGCVVLLQPLPTLPESPASEQMTAREALRRLQSQPRLTATQAEEYLREVRAERLTDGGTAAMGVRTVVHGGSLSGDPSDAGVQERSGCESGTNEEKVSLLKNRNSMPKAKTKPDLCEKCAGSSLTRKVTIYPVRLSGPGNLAGKQIHVHRVALYECDRCGHLMPTAAGLAKVNRCVQSGIDAFMGRLR